jgi:hypothetical protein
MNVLRLTLDEELVLETLVRDCLEGNDSTWPVPTSQLVRQEPSGYAEPRRFDFAQRNRVNVALIAKENLTEAQKQFLAKEMLENLAGLCLAKSMALLGEAPEAIADRVKENLRKVKQISG